jgi:hypothetical protein
MVHVAPEKGSQVGSCLADNEVVYVEEFADAVQGGFSVAIRGVGPRAECGL